MIPVSTLYTGDVCIKGYDARFVSGANYITSQFGVGQPRFLSFIINGWSNLKDFSLKFSVNLQVFTVVLYYMVALNEHF